MICVLYFTYVHNLMYVYNTHPQSRIITVYTYIHPSRMFKSAKFYNFLLRSRFCELYLHLILYNTNSLLYNVNDTFFWVIMHCMYRAVIVYILCHITNYKNCNVVIYIYCHFTLPVQCTINFNSVVQSNARSVHILMVCVQCTEYLLCSDKC